MVTSGMDWRKRKAQAGTVSSGRRAFRAAASSSAREASFPPRRGSMTHTGRWCALSSSTFPLASWKAQST